MFNYFNIDLPQKTTEDLFKWLSSYQLVDAPKEAMASYLKEAFLRFLYTLKIIPLESGKLLEIGSNPYFMSMLLQKITDYDLCFSNYFKAGWLDKDVQFRINGQGETIAFPFYHFNIEENNIPFENHTFDVILFCEIIEHLIIDPLNALLNIKKLLKPNGYLILTTPNVVRLENVAKFITGENIYDPYSGYGPYGRHNREYNKHEIHTLLTQLGFEIEMLFTSDITENFSNRICHISKFIELVKYRKMDLGQYIFCRAKNTGKADRKRPEWLYRSYSPEQMLNLSV